MLVKSLRFPISYLSPSLSPAKRSDRGEAETNRREITISNSHWDQLNVIALHSHTPHNFHLFCCWLLPPIAYILLVTQIFHKDLFLICFVNLLTYFLYNNLMSQIIKTTDNWWFWYYYFVASPNSANNVSRFRASRMGMRLERPRNETARRSVDHIVSDICATPTLASPTVSAVPVACLWWFNAVRKCSAPSLWQRS